MKLQLMRRHDWPERLNGIVAAHREWDGTIWWGQYDCGTIFSDAVWGMTDVDPIEELGRWTSEQSAMRAMLSSGHRSMKDYLDTKFDQVPVAHARRGDVGYPAEIFPLSCPSVIVGAEAVSRTQDGWIVFPTSKLSTAYRIG